jgi:hypothetical protein
MDFCFGVSAGHLLHTPDNLKNVFSERARGEFERFLVGVIVQLFALKNFLLGFEKPLLGDIQSFVPVDQPNTCFVEVSEKMGKLFFKLLFCFFILLVDLRNVLGKHLADFAAKDAVKVGLVYVLRNHEFLTGTVGARMEERRREKENNGMVEGYRRGLDEVNWYGMSIDIDGDKVGSLPTPALT